MFIPNVCKAFWHFFLFYFTNFFFLLQFTKLDSIIHSWLATKVWETLLQYIYTLESGLIMWNDSTRLMFPSWGPVIDASHLISSGVLRERHYRNVTIFDRTCSILRSPPFPHLNKMKPSFQIVGILFWEKTIKTDKELGSIEREKKISFPGNGKYVLYFRWLFKIEFFCSFHLKKSDSGSSSKSRPSSALREHWASISIVLWEFFLKSYKKYLVYFVWFSIPKQHLKSWQP